MTVISAVAEEWAARQAARGVTLKVRNGRLWLRPGAAYKEMSDTDRAFLRRRRDELKAIGLRGFVQPVKPEPETEPEPELCVHGRPVTEKDVVDTLKVLGDHALADYHAGRLSKHEAYERARCRLRQERQLEVSHV